MFSRETWQERVGAARNGAHGTLCKAAGLFKRDVKTKNPTERNCCHDGVVEGARPLVKMNMGFSVGGRKKKPCLSSNVLQ